jgi:hypothetical protein
MLYSTGSNGKSNRLCGVPHRGGTDSAKVLQEHRFQMHVSFAFSASQLVRVK